ncbi:MAG: hypothetical protein JW768_00300 [Chitinispirillaceae bacterium]|nr:hypothetical protein [Chitinispirillaceae bacterium]
MRIERKLSSGLMSDKVSQSAYTKNLTGEERISLLEELRYDLGKFLDYDYSGRFERVFSIVKREQC